MRLTWPSDDQPLVSRDLLIAGYASLEHSNGASDEQYHDTQ
jgi:hypothetical protein